jgi:hypothetical protein
MNEVVEPLMVNEPIREALIDRPSPAEICPDDRPPSLTDARRAHGAWSSSLPEADLQCLLQVIEAELIPQLVSGYSPARSFPQDLSP